MRTAITLIILILTVFSGLIMSDYLTTQKIPEKEAAQTMSDGLNLSISMGKTEFSSRSKDLTVDVKFKNQFDRNLPMSDIEYISINFSKVKRENLAMVRRGDVYSGTMYMSDIILPGWRKTMPVELKSKDSFEFSVDLTKLDWNDETSNVFSPDEKKGLGKIPAGDYFLYMEVKLNIPPTAGNLSGSKTYRSDNIEVSLK